MKILSILLVFAFLFFSHAQGTFAHILESQDPIGAVMHIQPDDDPVAGEESILFFEFKDKANVFEPANCECTFSVEQNGKEVYKQPASLSNWDQELKNVSIAYTFPAKGAYTVRITGKPLQDETFNEFNLAYDVHVNRVIEKDSKLNAQVQEEQAILVLPLGIVGLAVLLGAGFFLYSRKRKK